MLIKLLEHEWKSNWKIPAILIGVLLLFAVLTGATFAVPVWEDNMLALGMLVIFIWMTFYLGMIAVSLGISIYLAVRFYKSMYTDEGYLTHTLPVTARQLLLAKGIHMVIWTCLTSLAIVVSLMICGGMVLLFLNPFRVEMLELWQSVQLNWRQVMGFDTINFICSLIFMMIASTLYSTTLIMGSVSIGQNLTKHKILGSIGAYFALNIIVSMVSMVAVVPSMILQIANIDSYNPFTNMSIMYWVFGAVYLAISAGLYIISEYMTKKRLNLD